MATLNRWEIKGGAHSQIYLKGAPEKVLPMCEWEVGVKVKKKLSLKRRRFWEARLEELTNLGYRVLAVATKDMVLPAGNIVFDHGDLMGLTFAGWFVIDDPIRKESNLMLKTCKRAGIRAIMVTGDHKLTALAVAKQLGFSQAVIEGVEIDKMSDHQLRHSVKTINIFARVEPRHKLRIVQALQENGEIVAMTGDGVNDAPALKRANIGVAIGSGTDVAKDSADLVLLDNSFATVIEAIRRGRMAYQTIQKVMIYLVADSFTEMMVIVGSIFMQLPLPLLPAQILWIKLMEDSTPAMALAMDEVDEGVMNEPARRPNEPILDRKSVISIAVYAVVMNFVLLGMFYYFYQLSFGNIVYARTITFIGLGIASLFTIYSARALKTSIFKLNPFSNPWLITTTILGAALLLIAVYVPMVNNILQTTPLGLTEWIILICYALFGLTMYESLKRL